MTEPEAGQSQDRPTPEHPTGWRSLRVVTDLAHPFAWAFVGTIAVLIALSLGSTVTSLSAILVTIGIALFLALALDPAVHRLEARGMTRARAVTITCAIFTTFVAAVLVLAVPATVQQVVGFAQAVPSYLSDLKQSPWFQSFISTSGGAAFYESMLAQAQQWLSDPSRLVSLGVGALAFGAGIINAVSGTVIVVVLTIYFLASLDAMKSSLYQLVPAYGRAKVEELTEQITGSVGAMVAGGLTLSGLNAAFSFILLTILGGPYALMLAMLSLVITLIPMIGSVLFWVIASFVTLLYSPTAAIIFAITYFIYMQVEAYVITPRIMGRAASIPGALVLIGAMVGATLLGLLGALVAVPVTASILLVLREVYIPRQNAKTASQGHSWPSGPTAGATTATSVAQSE